MDRTSLCTGFEGPLTSDPSYRRWQEPCRKPQGNSYSAVKTTADANRRDLHSGRDARRCPAGPKPRPGARRHRRPGRRLAETEAGVTALACAAPQGPRTGEKDRREQGRHTCGDLATGSWVIETTVRLSQYSPPPLLPAQGHLHVPLQRGSRSHAQPACELPGAKPRPARLSAQLAGTSGSDGRRGGGRRSGRGSGCGASRAFVRRGTRFVGRARRRCGGPNCAIRKRPNGCACLAQELRGLPGTPRSTSPQMSAAPVTLPPGKPRENRAKRALLQ